MSIRFLLLWIVLRQLSITSSCESEFLVYNDSDTKESTQKSPSESAQVPAPDQAKATHCLPHQGLESTTLLGQPSLTGRWTHQQFCIYNDRSLSGMEMRHMHENLCKISPILRSLWGFMASMCRSDLPGRKSGRQGAAPSAVELCCRLERCRVEWSILAGGAPGQCTMDGSPKTSTDAQEKAVKKSKEARCANTCNPQRKGKRCEPGHRRFWTSDSPAECHRATLAYSYEYLSDSSTASLTGRARGSTAENHTGSSQKAQRCVTTGIAKHGQRCSHQGRAAADKTIACSGNSSWKGTQGIAASTTGEIQFTQCMEVLSQPSGDAMAGLQRSIHGAREANERASHCSSNRTGTGEGKPGHSQSVSRHRVKGRHHECERRGAGQGSHRNGIPSHTRRPDQLANKSGSAATISNTDVGRRAKGPQETKNRRKARPWYQAIRTLCYSAGVWLGRVNTIPESIAPWPMQHDPCVHPCILKWTHSVLEEPSFVSEWNAVDIAFHLAWELNMQTRIPVLSQPVYRNRSAQPRVSQVTFADAVSIRIGRFDCDEVHDYVVSTSALRHAQKPWSLYGTDVTCVHQFPHKSKTQVQYIAAH